MKAIMVLSLLFISFFSSSAFAGARRVLITVGKDGADNKWATEMCEFVHRSVNFASEGNIDSRCMWLSANEFSNPEINKLSRSGEYVFLLDLRENFNGDKILRLVNLDKQDDTDFKQLSWTIEKKAEDWKVKLHKLIKSSFEFDLQKEAVKMYLLANGVSESKEIAVNKEGAFVTSATGETISGKMAYNIFKEEAPKNKHYLRAGIEIMAGLGLGMKGYYAHLEAMKRDWDYPTGRDFYKSKIIGTDGYRFDDNSIGVNETHAYAGMAYYMIARSNGFNSMESFVATLAASSAWEFLIEYREVVSLNDQVITPVGGAAIGEAYHQIAKIFRKRKGSIVDQVLGTMFDAPTAMHSWADKHYGSPKDLSNYDFNEDFWSKVDVEAAIVSNSKRPNKSDYRISLDAKIINIGAYEEAGKTSKVLTDTAFSEIIYKFPGNKNDTMEDFTFIVKNVLAAYYSKNLGKDINGNLEGYNFFIGPSNGVEFYDNYQQEDQNKNRDFMSVVKVLGTSIHLDFYTKGYKLTCNLDVFGDFAMVRNYALNEYKKEKGVSGVTSVLKNNDYYYATGLTTSANIVLTKSRFEVGAAVTEHRMTSINSRYRDMNTTGLALDDRRRVSEVWVAYSFTRDLKFKLSYEKVDRSGGIEGFGFFEGSETRKVGSLVYNFR